MKIISIFTLALISVAAFASHHPTHRDVLHWQSEYKKVTCYQYFYLREKFSCIDTLLSIVGKHTNKILENNNIFINEFNANYICNTPQPHLYQKQW